MWGTQQGVVATVIKLKYLCLVQVSVEQLFSTPAVWGLHLGLGASIFRSPFPPKYLTIFGEIFPNLNVDSQIKIKEEHTV